MICLGARKTQWQERELVGQLREKSMKSKMTILSGNKAVSNDFLKLLKQVECNDFIELPMKSRT